MPDSPTPEILVPISLATRALTVLDAIFDGADPDDFDLPDWVFAEYHAIERAVLEASGQLTLELPGCAEAQS